MTESPNGAFLAPFHAILDGRPRDTFAVSISGPEGVVFRSVTLILAHHFGGIETQTEYQSKHPESLGISSVDLMNMGVSATGINPLAARPTIIPRSSWWGSLPLGELNSPRWLPSYRNITHAIIHHTGAAAHKQPADSSISRRLGRSIWRWHADGSDASANA